MALSPGNLTCLYVNTTCPANYTGIASIASSEPNDGLYNIPTRTSRTTPTTHSTSAARRQHPTHHARPQLPREQQLHGLRTKHHLQLERLHRSGQRPDNVQLHPESDHVPELQRKRLVRDELDKHELCVDQHYNWTVQPATLRVQRLGVNVELHDRERRRHHLPRQQHQLRLPQQQQQP